MRLAYLLLPGIIVCACVHVYMCVGECVHVYVSLAGHRLRGSRLRGLEPINWHICEGVRLLWARSTDRLGGEKHGPKCGKLAEGAGQA